LGGKRPMHCEGGALPVGCTESSAPQRDGSLTQRIALSRVETVCTTTTSGVR
jgi:hypothetical protein